MTNDLDTLIVADAARQILESRAAQSTMESLEKDHIEAALSIDPLAHTRQTYLEAVHDELMAIKALREFWSGLQSLHHSGQMAQKRMDEDEDG